MVQRIVGILQLDIARHVAVVVLVVSDTVPGHHHLLVVVTLAPSSGRRTRSASAAATTSAGSLLVLAIRRLIIRAIFAVLLHSFVFRPSILEPHFDLKKKIKINKILKIEFKLNFRKYIVIGKCI